MGVLAETLFAAYGMAGRLGTPLVSLYLARRAQRGKEDRQRSGERLGRASAARPPGPLLWIHAASVGESLAVLPLLRALRQSRPELALLMTSGTVTSARLLAERLPAGVLHQYVPVDLPQAVARFLEHWRPGIALFVESELWPTTLRQLSRRGIPFALVNARMSARSFARWSRARPLARALLDRFSLVLAESETSADRFRRLGASRVQATGNLKVAAAELEGRDEALARAVEGRPIWIAASTHPGEESLVLDAHSRLLARHPALLTILCPRHPERGEGLAREIADRGLPLARRSQGQLPDTKDQIYLADTLGELGPLYRVSRLALVGGSLVSKGGQNLLEPARLGLPVLAGPNTQNHAEAAARLERAGALLRVADAESLAATVGRLFDDEAERVRRGAAAAAAAASEAEVLDRVLGALQPLLRTLAR
ncbi:MAG TPA: 3-deoxy-D-manno-octulosonic acid transferase [Kiloniellales bacterium]|nr:3-deoxy-D-manno-octulosonic acid transferase [Kiloniellales bacterium]